MSARAELEGWLVLNVGSREAEECLAIVERIIAEECEQVPVLEPGSLTGGIDRTPSPYWKNHGQGLDAIPCPTCQDAKWVCEAHPDKPWNETGCTCNAGMPCPTCGGDFKRTAPFSEMIGKRWGAIDPHGEGCRCERCYRPKRSKP